MFLWLFSVLLVSAPPQLAAGKSTSAEQQRPRSSKAIWEGHSGGFLVRWTLSDITVAASNNLPRVLFSARSLAQSGYREYETSSRSDSEEPVGTQGECSYRRSFKLLSVIGSVVSFEDYEFSSCKREAHPSAYTRFTSVDFSKAGDVTYSPGEIDQTKLGKLATLTDFFPEDEIVSALLADRAVKKALTGRRASASPRTTADLIKIFDDEQLSIESADGCTYSLPGDLLTRFAFHHLEGNKVAVRLALPPDVGACRTMHTQLGILLSLPERLKKPLALAANSTEGFLMKDRQIRFGDRMTTISFVLKSSHRPQIRNRR